MLPINDLNYIKGSIADAYDILGSELNYYAFDTTSIQDSPYKESKSKKYKNSVKLKGIVRLNPKPEEVTPVGVTAEVDALFRFSLIELAKNQVSIADMRSGRISYNNKVYDIINVVPLTQLNNEAVTYNVEGKTAKK